MVNGLPLALRADADPLGKRHKFRQGMCLQFLHHSLAMGFDGPFGTAYRPSDLLVVITADDKLKDFSLAWRQSPDTGTHAVQFVLQIA